MDDFYLAFGVVFPLFCMMSLGYFLRRIGLFNADFLQQLNNLCFKVFLPAILFVNVYKSDFSNNFPIKLVAYAVTGILVCFGALMLLIPCIEKSNMRRGVMVQGIFRSNFILFGIPITLSVLGEESVGVAAVLIAFAVPLFNVFSVVALETFSGGKTTLLAMLKGVLKNPLIIASALALCFVVSGVRLPAVVVKTVTDISQIATPLALIALGGTFAFSGLKGNGRALVLCVLGRLVLVPLAFLGIGVLLGFGAVELVVLLGMAGTPTAVSSYTMAQSMGGDSVLAGQIVVMGSIGSVVSLFLWITVLKQLNLI